MSGWWRRVRGAFWALPLVFTFVAALLGLGLSRLDDLLNTSFIVPFLFAGGPEGARALLSAIITSMISFTGLVFSITIVVLQLTSSQFSPRVLRSFLHDRFNQFALGVFIATFTYALFVLRSVRGTAQVNPFVPQMAVTVAFAFVLASVLVFLGYIHHIAQTIRAATIVANIGADTRELLEQRYPAQARPVDPVAPPDGPSWPVSAAKPGAVQRIDDDGLAALAEREGVTIRLQKAVGEFVPAGGTLMVVYGGDAPGESQLREAVQLGEERSLDEDVGFGLRQLVDIAERALSPGVNDPTTAVQAVDQLHDLLRRLATRPLPPRQRVGDDGRLLVDVPQPTFEDYLELGVEEIARWGADATRVQRRLRVMLLDLLEAARPEHRPAVARALARYGQDDAVTDVGVGAATDVGLR